MSIIKLYENLCDINFFKKPKPVKTSHKGFLKKEANILLPDL